MVVKTSVGEVRGRVVSAPLGHVTADVTVDQYLGIPFAVPPVGQLRYADPVPLDHLPSGIRPLTHRYAIVRPLSTVQYTSAFFCEKCAHFNTF